MTRAGALKIKVGDEVRIDTLWNRTEPPRNKILNPAKVLDVRNVGGSQTGVLLTVKTASGKTIELDAGWFQA
jgi:hypothetical protein